MSRSKQLRLALIFGAFAACASATAVVLLVQPEASNAYQVPVPTGEPPFMTAQDFIAAGKPVPLKDPTLPVCPPASPDPGFASAEDAKRANVSIPRAPATCQIDHSTGLFQERPAQPPLIQPLRSNSRRGKKSTGRSLAHAGPIAYHWVGPATPAYNRHGVGSVIEVVNPEVTRGEREFVNGRSYALAPDNNRVEAGWTERGAFSDLQFAYGCDSLGCFYDTARSYPVSPYGWYSFRAFHCGLPGEKKACGEIYYDYEWRRLVTTDLVRCTNSNGSGNCMVENRSEVLSEDGTPHLAFGGVGMDFAVGELMLDETWDTWTTAYPTVVTATSPYVVSWSAQYSNFRACQTSCN